MRVSTLLAGIGAVGIAGAASADLNVFLDTDTDGVPVVFEFEQDTAGPITDIAWDLDHDAFSPSWGSELQIVLTHVGTGNSISMGGGDITVDIEFGWGNTSGNFHTDGTVSAADIGLDEFDSSGRWLVSVFESFDDGGIDGHIIGTITLLKAIPGPGALALLGLAGLCGTRRRR